MLSWLAAAVLGPVAILVLVVGFYEGRKAYWDYQVKQMCEKDGGAKVFEMVEMAPPEYVLLLNQFGELSPPQEHAASRGAPIVHRNTSHYIRRSDPEVRRDELSVIRKSDGKVLGVKVSYSRVGGDFPTGITHPSYFSCPEQPADIFTLVIRSSREQR